MSTGMWVRGQDENTAIICKRAVNFQDHKCKRYVDTDTNSNWQRTRQKRKEIPTKMIDCQIPCNKCNMQFVHLPLSGANL